MKVIPIDAGKAVLVLKLARQQLAELQKTKNSIPNAEMKVEAERVVTRYQDAINWLHELAMGKADG